MKILLGVLLSGLGLFVLFTWWALESSGVATIQTRMPDGGTRSTHVWYAEPDGELWIEAGTPENTWYVDVQRDPGVTLSMGDSEPDRSSDAYEAQTIPGEAAHQRIRSLLREKYGIRDRWIDLLFDTSRSIAVRLVPKNEADDPESERSR